MVLLVKRWEIEMGGQSILLLMGLNMITLLQKNCYFRCSGPLDVNRIKFCDKDNQAAKHDLK